MYDLFEQVEFEEPIRRLLSEGISPTIISANKLSMQAMKHNVPGDLFKADKLIGDANKEDYIALILPGGALNADNLRMNNKAREWIHFFLNNDRLIAAICHAPWLLVSADAIEERRVTSYFTLQDDIRNVGAEWIDQPVVVDGNLITSRKPADLDDFDTAIIDWLSTHTSSNNKPLSKSNI